VAICRYLESLHPEPNLFGRTPEESLLSRCGPAGRR
jgi:glutathione S-transferase